MPKVFTPVSFGKYASSLVVKLFELSAFSTLHFSSSFLGDFRRHISFEVLVRFLSSWLVGAGYPSGGVHAHPGLTFPFPHLGFLGCHYGASLIVAHY